MKGIALYLVIHILLLVGCGESSAEAEQKVEYAQIEAEVIWFRETPELAAGFLDNYEAELLQLYQYFFDVGYQSFYYYVIPESGRISCCVNGRDVEWNEVEISDRIEAFCERFACTKIHWGKKRCHDQPGIEFKLPIVIAKKGMIHSELIYSLCSDPEHDVEDSTLLPVPDHANWSVFYQELV